MKDDLHYMLKKMIFIDIGVGLILMSAIYFIYKEFTIIFLLGYVLASVNFFLSSFVAKFTFYGDNLKSQGILLISSALKVLLVCIVGVVVFKFRNLYVIPYLGGYTCHFISIMIYGLNKKNF